MRYLRMIVAMAIYGVMMQGCFAAQSPTSQPKVETNIVVKNLLGKPITMSFNHDVHKLENNEEATTPPNTSIIYLGDPLFCPAWSRFMTPPRTRVMIVNNLGIRIMMLQDGQLKYPIENRNFSLVPRSCRIIFAEKIQTEKEKRQQLYQPLLDAAKAGNLAEVKRLIEKENLPVDATDQGSNDTPLMIAISAGNLDIVKYLVDHGANLEAKNYNNNTVLGIAVFSKHFDIVKYLVEHKANVNAPQLVRTPLALAAEAGSLDIVRYLIEHGADIEPKWFTPLMTASTAGQFEIVKYLVEKKKALVNPKDTTNNYTPLMLVACGWYSHPEIAQYLVEHGADVNAKDINGKTVLMCAAERGYLEIMEYLIGQGALIDAKDNNGKAALDLAFEHGHKKAVVLLAVAQAKLKKTVKARPKSTTKKPQQKKKTQAPKK